MAREETYWVIKQATALRREGNNAAALALLQDFLQQPDIFAPDKIHVGIADCYRAVHQREKARTHYLRALDLYDRNIFALVNLGFLLINEGSRDSARGYFERALAIDPDNTYAQRGFAETGDREPYAPPPATPISAPVPAPVKAAIQPVKAGVTVDELRGQIQDNPRQIGLYERLLVLLQQQGDIPAAREVAEQMLGIDAYNAAAKKCLRTTPANPVPAFKQAAALPAPAMPAPAVTAVQPPPPPLAAPLKDTASSPAMVEMDEITVIVTLGSESRTVTFLRPPTDKPYRVEVMAGDASSLHPHENKKQVIDLTGVSLAAPAP